MKSNHVITAEPVNGEPVTMPSMAGANMPNLKKQPTMKKHKQPLAGWQGKRREQVEFAATLFAAAIGGIFMIAVILTILKIVN